jgi:phosphatidylserine synthase 2
MRRRNSVVAAIGSHGAHTQPQPQPQQQPQQQQVDGGGGGGGANDHQLAVVANAQPFLKENNFLDFLYKPHTLTALIVAIVLIIYAGFLRVPPSSTDVYSAEMQDARAGLSLAAAVFILYCTVQLRDSTLIRPHPAIWRAVHSIGILYLLCLLFLLALTPSQGRQALSLVYPELGKPLTERAYASDCRIFTPDKYQASRSVFDYFYNLRLGIWDIYMIAHSVGWFGKSLMLRSFGLSWVLSVLFEVLEITFQDVLHNFRECWWDHVILDVFTMNALGIAVGMYVGRKLEVRQYNWSGVSKIPTRTGKAARVLLQFTPFSFTKYKWNIFDSPQSFAAILLLIVYLETVEINSFFLKHVLWIPPPNPLNSYRLTFWFLIAIPSLHEYYIYVSAPPNSSGTTRLGQNCWLALLLAFVEILVTLKYSPGQFHWSFPPHVRAAWFTFFALFGLWHHSLSLSFSAGIGLREGKICEIGASYISTPNDRRRRRRRHRRIHQHTPDRSLLQMGFISARSWICCFSSPL